MLLLFCAILQRALFLPEDGFESCPKATQVAFIDQSKAGRFLDSFCHPPQGKNKCTPSFCNREFPTIRWGIQTVDKVGLLSSRTSDRCHWCGDPYPKSLENTTFLKKNGLPRQCAHWLAMTCFGVCLHIENTRDFTRVFLCHIIPILRPFGGVRVDIFPDLPIVRLAPDHVLVVGALPKFPLQAHIAALIC